MGSAAMKAHSDALKRRWSDPGYRAQQTAANRAAAADQALLLRDPLARKQHGQAIKIGNRIARKGRR